MTQRKYEMRRRAAAVEATRARILEATGACHGERGITDTSMDDVARRAGVAIGTVYRHFPTLETLVGACGKIFMDRFALPEPQEAAELFRGVSTREQRLSRLVEVLAERYRGGALGFVRVREANEAFEATARAHERIERSIDALVAEALRPLRYSQARRQLVRALVDPRVWQSLVEHGADPDSAQRSLLAILAAV